MLVAMWGVWLAISHPPVPTPTALSRGIRIAPQRRHFLGANKYRAIRQVFKLSRHRPVCQVSSQVALTSKLPLSICSARNPAKMGGEFPLGHLSLSTSGPLECALRGTVLLNHPYFNKGSAFTKEERQDFGLSGLLPPNIQTLEQQVQRAYQQYSTRQDDLAKNTFLSSMKEQNEVLFFKVRRFSAWCGGVTVL